MLYLSGCDGAPSGGGGIPVDPLDQEQRFLMTAAAAGASGRATQSAALRAALEATAQAASYETQTVGEAMLLAEQLRVKQAEFDLESTRIASEAQATLTVIQASINSGQATQQYRATGTPLAATQNAVARADESNARKADFRMDYIDPLNQALPSIIIVTLLALAAFFFSLLTWQGVSFWKRIAPTLERRMQVLLHAGRIVIILDPKSPGNPVNVLQPDRMFNPGERVVNGLMESVGGAAPQLQSVATAGALQAAIEHERRWQEPNPNVNMPLPDTRPRIEVIDGDNRQIGGWIDEVETKVLETGQN